MGPGGHLSFTSTEMRAMEADLGRVPRVPGLRRSQVQVLAALARAPLGLRSQRAVARASGLSPTAAGRALHELVDLDLVRNETVMLAEGEAVEADVWRVSDSTRWRDIAPVVRQTVLPVSSQPAEAPSRLPRRLWHLFWNVDPATLDLESDAGFIATRLLTAGDLQGLSWACSHLPDDALAEASRNRASDPATRALVANVLAAR